VDNLDRILMSEEVVSPSARFAASVMDAIEAVAGEPPPLPFPWGRFGSGLLACAVWAVSGAWLVRRGGLSMLDVPLAELAAVRTGIRGGDDTRQPSSLVGSENPGPDQSSVAPEGSAAVRRSNPERREAVDTGKELMERPVYRRQVLRWGVTVSIRGV